MVEEFVLVTIQPGAVGGETNSAYGPSTDPDALRGAGELLADGADPPMRVLVLPLQPPVWDSA